MFRLTISFKWSGPNPMKRSYLSWYVCLLSLPRESLLMHYFSIELSVEYYARIRGIESILLSVSFPFFTSLCVRSNFSLTLSRLQMAQSAKRTHVLRSIGRRNDKRSRQRQPDLTRNSSSTYPSFATCLSRTSYAVRTLASRASPNQTDSTFTRFQL